MEKHPDLINKVSRDFVARLQRMHNTVSFIHFTNPDKNYSPQVRSYLSALTSTFLEKDVFVSTMEDKNSLEQIRSTLTDLELDQKQIDEFVEYLNISYEKMKSIDTI